MQASDISNVVALFPCDCGSESYTVELSNGTRIDTCDDCETFEDCAHCGASELTDEMSESNMGYLCRPCNAKLPECEDCEQKFDSDELTETNGKSVCETCLSDNYIFCERCEAYSDETDGAGEVTTSVYRNGWRQRTSQVWCGSCFSDAYHCDTCAENFDEDYRPQREADGDIMCRECFNENYSHCDRCGNAVHTDEAVNDDYSTYCEPCAERSGSWRTRLRHEGAFSVCILRQFQF